MPKIFISYRREDTQRTAKCLYDLLEAHYGEDDEENVFLDVDSIPLGHNFTEYLEDKVNQCDVLLSLIGRKWLTAINEKGKSHLKNGDDFVRIEILSGLKLEKIVIPTLVHGADMPEANSMPKEFNEFSQMQAARLRQGSRFKEDVDRLIEQIDSRHIDALRQEEEETRKEDELYKKELTDKTFENLIREVIDKAEGKLTPSDLKKVKELCLEDYDGDVSLSNFYDVYYDIPLDLSILSKLTELRKLELQADCADLTPLSNLGGLNKLSIGGTRYHRTSVDCLHSALRTPLDLTPLARLGYTADKFEWRSSDRELKPYFKKCDKLLARFPRNDEDDAELSRLREQLKDARSAGLSELCLNGHGIRELAPLAGITSLSELSLNCNAIVDLYPLCNIQNLEVLKLNKNQIEYLAPLSILNYLGDGYLYWLELAENKLSDLGPLGWIGQLSQLNLLKNNITDLRPLAKLSNMKWLLLRENKISDLRPLSGMKNLEILTLSGNRVSDLTPLAGLKKLKSLDLRVNRITDLTPLAGLKKLKVLSLEHNKITDLSPLADLTNLEQLYLGNIELTDLKPLMKLKKLYRVSFSAKKTMDLKPLQNLRCGEFQIGGDYLKRTKSEIAKIEAQFPGQYFCRWNSTRQQTLEQEGGWDDHDPWSRC